MFFTLNLCNAWIYLEFLHTFRSAHPNFVVKPKDQRVGMNGLAQFECVAEGNPPPSVFWSKEGSQVSLKK